MERAAKMEKLAAMKRAASKRANLNRVDGGARSKKKWEEIHPNLLGNIFSWIRTDELVHTVPVVCRSWGDALVLPFPWKKIDVRGCCFSDSGAYSNSDLTVRALFLRSYWFLNSFKAFHITDVCFQDAIRSGRMLTVLKMPFTTEVTDLTLKECAEYLPQALISLDISYCPNITSEGIKLFGKYCKRLVKLKRNYPMRNGGAAKVDESEAIAVAHSMPNLQHLKLCFGLFSNEGLREIMASCKLLTSLDIRECSNVRVS